MKITCKHAMSALAVMAALAFAVDAQAFWGSSGGSWGSSGGSSGGSYGSWGSSGGSHGSWGSSGGSHGSWGSSGGSHGSWGSSGGSHGSCGSSGGSHGSWGSSGGSHGSWGSSGGSHGSWGSSGGSHGSHGGTVIIESAPAEVEVEVEAQGASLSSPRYGRIVRRATTGSGTLHVNVPEEAKVFVNDTLTTSTGTQRQYVSRGLQSGRNYAYTVRVEFERNGETMSETKQAMLTAGREVSLTFEPSATAENVVEKAEPTTTELTLHVPADAKVTLAGTLTKQTGEMRQFSTTQLTQGQAWNSYVILVELEHNGEMIQQERTITLTGGQSHEESFDFEAALLASK